MFVGVAQDAMQQARTNALALQRRLHADQGNEQERPVRLHKETTAASVPPTSSRALALAPPLDERHHHPVLLQAAQAAEQHCMSPISTAPHE